MQNTGETRWRHMSSMRILLNFAEKWKSLRFLKENFKKNAAHFEI